MPRSTRWTAPVGDPLQERWRPPARRAPNVYRVLVGFGPDDVPALLLAGNKAGVGNRWYDQNVALANERFEAYLTVLARSTTAAEEHRRVVSRKAGTATTLTTMSAAPSPAIELRERTPPGEANAAAPPTEPPSPC